MKPFWLFICLFFLSVASTEASLVQTCNQILMTKATDQTHNKKSKSQVNLLEQDQLKDVIILHFLKNNNEPFFLLTVESGLVKLDESVDALYRIISNWAKDSEVKIARHSDLKNDMKSSRKSDRTDKVLYLTFTGSPDEVYLFIEELRLLKPNYSVHVSALNMNKTQVNKVLFAFFIICSNCQLNDEEKLLLKSDEFYDPISGAASAFYEIEDYNLPFSVYFFFKDIADQVWRTEGQKQRVTSQFEQLGL
ncbi:MAG: hypothetical protein KDD40_01250, partial [Bdellovibrionales bacterium]|nr:hypothetical protein [Bdellovibrionales bacterium]